MGEPTRSLLNNVPNTTNLFLIKMQKLWTVMTSFRVGELGFLFYITKFKIPTMKSMPTQGRVGLKALGMMRQGQRRNRTPAATDGPRGSAQPYRISSQSCAAPQRLYWHTAGTTPPCQPAPPTAMKKHFFARIRNFAIRNNFATTAFLSWNAMS